MFFCLHLWKNLSACSFGYANCREKKTTLRIMNIFSSCTTNNQLSLLVACCEETLSPVLIINTSFISQGMVEIHRVNAHEKQRYMFSPVLYWAFYLAILKLPRKINLWTEPCSKSNTLQRPLCGAGTKGPVRMGLHLTLFLDIRKAVQTVLTETLRIFGQMWCILHTQRGSCTQTTAQQ